MIGRRRARGGALRTRSLRTRTVASVLVLLMVLLAVLDFSVDVALGSRLRGEIEQRLQDRVETAQALSGSLTDTQIVDRISGQGVSVYLRTRSGTVVTAGPTPEQIDAEAKAPSGAGAKPPADPAGETGKTQAPPPTAMPNPTGSVRQVGTVLTLDGRLPDGSIVRVAADSSQVERTLAQLRWILIVSSLGVLLVATVLLMIVVRRSLSPLEEMTALARSITSGDRGRRLRPDRKRSEIGRTASAFDEMLDEVEGAEKSAIESERRMRDFLSDAAHELRTPVTGMQAAAESLLRNQSSRRRREELAVHVVRESRHAARLVDDMLMMSRVDQGLELLRDTFDLADAARSAADRLSLRQPGLTVSVTSAGPVPVLADPDRIAQVLGNLLLNAARVASRISIVVRHDDGRAVVDVIDNGPGVPEEVRERIFERLVRLDESRDRSSGGLGLGLPIARGIATAHGGDLTCLDVSSGALFRLRLPCEPGTCPNHLTSAILGLVGD